MAEDISILPHEPGDLPHAVRAPNERDLREMTRWCRDLDRPGSFAFWGVGSCYLFQFSDENLAFEFRMAWG